MKLSKAERDARDELRAMINGYCPGCGEITSGCICRPLLEATPAGMQAVIPGAETRAIPNKRLSPKKKQSGEPMELEMTEKKEPELF